MKNKIDAFFNKYPFLKWITNRFVLVTVFFLLWITFFDTYSYFDHKAIDKEIEKLKKNKEYYTTESSLDLQKIKKLQKSEEIEKYAREKYYMKRENEDIYIIDFPNDSLSDAQE